MPSLFPVAKKIDASADSFGDGFGAFSLYVERKVRYLKAKNRGLRETLLPKWARTYKGIPAEETKTFPWPGASNLVVQLAATHADELLARVMAIYANDPLFICKMLSDIPEGGEEKRELLEQFLSESAVDPDTLDLYRVEEIWWSSTIRYGTGIIKFPWEYVTQKQFVYINGGTEEGEKANYDTKLLTKRDGPHPENVPLHRFGIDPKCSTLSNSDFFYHTISYDRYELERLKYKTAVYDEEAIEFILGQGADRHGPDEFEKQNEEQKKAITEPDDHLTPKWDVEECWFIYNKDGDNYSCIAYYHEMSKTLLGAIFNPYPETIQPFEDAKLAYDDDAYHGYGFCEMLESYQREITTIHNYRVDNRQFSTTGIGRMNKNSKLSSLIQIHPGIIIPADEGELEFFPPNTAAGLITTEDEQLTLALAKERSGVDPAIGGAGGGQVNSKKGNFSTQGAGILQWQNNRNNLRMSDMRSAHVRMGRKLLRLYAEFGLGTAIRKYGDRAELLSKALADYKDGKLGLVIKPATASYNREVEKQNDILLASTLERLYQGDAQMIQAMGQPGIPDDLKQYYVEVFSAKNQLMKHILRNFGHDDASRLVPVPQSLKQERLNANRATNNNPSQIAQTQGAVPVGGFPNTGGIPATSAGASGRASES